MSDDTARAREYHILNGDTVTDDGFWVGPIKYWDNETRQYIENRFKASTLSYYGGSGTGDTPAEALGKARKAEAKRLAQIDEDKAITAAYAGDARRMAPATDTSGLLGTIPTSLKPGKRVRLWAHGRRRIGIVGTVSKTGARARVIYFTPSSPYPHLTTYSRTDLGEIDA